MKRAWIFGLSMWSCACQPTEHLAWDPPAGTQSFILALEEPECSGRTTCEAARAYRGDVLEEPFLLPEDHYRIYLLAYPYGLETLGVAEGPLQSCLNLSGSLLCQPGQPLPESSVFAAEISGSDAGDFEPVPLASEAIRAILIPRLGAEACANRGRCLDEAGECTDCPDTAEVLLPGAPELPQPVQLIPFSCPGGWTESDGICLPLEEARALSSGACTRGTVQRRGDSTCTPLYAACPSGQDRFSELTPPGAIYVDANVATSGSGSSDSPLRTIAEALALAPLGTAVTLAPGIYRECFEVDTQLIGACPEQTLIAAADCGGLTMAGASARLENVAVDGELRIEALDGARLLGVDVENRTGDCIVSRASSLQAQSVAVRECTAGLDVTGGALTLEDFVSESAEIGLRLTGADFSASRLVIRRGSIGFQMLDESVGSVSNVLIEGTGRFAANIDGAHLTMENVAVRDTSFSPDEGRAFALASTRFDSSVRLDAVAIERVANAGIAIEVAGGHTMSTTITDVYMHDIRSTLSYDSYGFFARGAVTASVSRMALLGVERISLAAFDGSEVQVNGLVVRAGRLRSDAGVQVRQGTASISNALIEDVIYKGAVVGVGLPGSSAGGDLYLENVLIRKVGEGVGTDTRIEPLGIYLEADGELEARKVEIDDVNGGGLAFGTKEEELSPARSTVSDLTLADIRRIGIPSALHDGLAIFASNTLSGTRIHVTGADAALEVFGGDTDLSNAYFESTGISAPRPAVSVTGASVRLSRTHVRSFDPVFISRSAIVDLEDVFMEAPLPMMNEDVFLALGGEVNFDRFVLDGATSHANGIALCGSTTRRAANMTVKRFINGNAFSVFGGRVETLQNFSFDGNFIGIVVSDTCRGEEIQAPLLNASDGVVRAQAAGLRVLSRDWDVANALVRVRYLADTPVQMARGASN
jgi:hypothetical protein